MVFNGIMAAFVLVFTVVVIGYLWVHAQWHAARLEFTDPQMRRNWTIAAFALFSVLVSFTLSAGASGWLTRFDHLPPPMLGFFTILVVAGFYLGTSRFGTILVKHTPLHALIGFHAFRILAEIVIISGVKEGIAPRALSFEGYNFDIVTGVTALPLAWYIQRNPNPRLVWWWNAMAAAFLVVIAFIAFTSMPLPIRIFTEEPANTWVTRLPYTLLPGILVTFAIAGQVLIFRKLRLVRA